MYKDMHMCSYILVYTHMHTQIQLTLLVTSLTERQKYFSLEGQVRFVLSLRPAFSQEKNKV